MNATGFGSLTGLIKHLGKSGICEVDETEKGWFIRYIDRSPDTMKRTEADQKRVRMERNEAEWEQKLLDEQIQRALEREIVVDEMDVYADRLHQVSGDDSDCDTDDNESDNSNERTLETDSLVEKNNVKNSNGAELKVKVCESPAISKSDLIRSEGCEKIKLVVTTVQSQIQKVQLKRINPFKMSRTHL